uniref:Short/branched chain specific acyl-CoA dehydrogenase, mitochondrial n=1 Tax=Neobodo designis TaxID=312471 RepID=A0A7S1PNA5_NEODS|mmetsp:Transcript_14648/g.45408  ORF Transcript_14648/g.45408 Transcript_14648/m.45408 type:complete len:407 (+) Transcript_14648:47-1267(+)|eukprot:CAMPEP_0174835552 /NCGR_PEP_ID=MMETSP1114-20130205/5466_1 /TAXON_ID=312471 /ORGANISM="Neobodo designis, Strain CCAP 1951/1" /LENGTH=406 /DNA_ID=CAMNT_0016069503 /DNA_START=47 /DNA_END=1267 /DNA_ORIENTATION=-
MRRVASRCVAAAAAAQTRTCVATPCTKLLDDEKMLVENVREFAQKVIKPKVREMDEAQKMDPAIIQQCFENGLMGIEVPEKNQGTGMSFFASVLAIEELAKVDGAVSVMVDVQNTLVNNIFFNFANEEQRAKYLPMLARDTVGCFCLTEPGSGSDAFALKTRAEKKGDDYVINGSKIYITNAGEANLFLVMANVDPSKGYKGITCFVVDKRVHKGVKIGRKENKMGIRASSTCEVIFEDVVVPKENIVLSEGRGYKIAIEALNEGRIGIGAQMVGIAQGALDTAMPYLFERKQFGQYIGDFQGMQFQYAQASMDIHAARLMVYNAGRKKMAGEAFVEDAAMAKLFASQVAERTASKAIEWMGGNGFIKEYDAEKFYRDAKIGAIYEGTTNIQLHTLAKFVKDRYTK